MVDVRFKHIANLKGDKGDKGEKGDTGPISIPAGASAKTVSATTPADLRVRTLSDGRWVLEGDIPRGLPGVNGVANDTATAEQLLAEDSQTHAALRQIVPTIVSITQFIRAGESLDPTGNSAADNTVIIQRAVNTLTAAWAQDRVPRQIYFPDGTYMLSDSGFVPGSDRSRYAIRWRSGVGIATSSRRGVIFVCPPTASAFVAAVNTAWMEIEDVYCDPHVVDGHLQTNSTYTAQFKAWYIQGLKNARFDDVFVRNTFSTGFGCDYLRNVYVSGEADNCGRGIKELGVDPETTSGASGFGIGTGLYEVEDYTLDVVARNCGFHGVFTETQGGGKYLSKGSRIKAYCEGNYVGFRDCGSSGLQLDLVSRNSTLAEIVHGVTVLSRDVGRSGRARIDLADGVTGILFTHTDNASSYYYTGSIRNMSGDGVSVAPTGGPKIFNHGEFDALRINSCGGHAINIDRAAPYLTLRGVSEWDNGGLGLYLGNLSGAATATDLTILGCSFEDGVFITQHLEGTPIIASNRGLSTDETSGIVSTTPIGVDGVRVVAGSALTTKSVSYRWQYKRLFEPEWSATISTSVSQVDITDLAPGSTYEFRVAAVIDGVQGPWKASTNAQAAVAGEPTVIDKFQRADGTLDGTQLPDGSVYPTWQLYTKNAGVMGTVDSYAKGTSGGPVFALIPTTKLRGAIGTILPYVTSVEENRRMGLVFGFKDFDNYYRIDAHLQAASYHLAIRKVKDGVTTKLSEAPVGPDSGLAIRVAFDATTQRIEWFQNGQYVDSFTDPDLTSIERVGLFADFSVDPGTKYSTFRGWNVGA